MLILIQIYKTVPNTIFDFEFLWFQANKINIRNQLQLFYGP